MQLQDLYNLIEVHLGNGIECESNENMDKKRVKLPISKEYGGGFATGSTYESAILKIIEKAKPFLLQNGSESPTFKECWNNWIKIKEGQDRSPNTISNYKQIAKNHLIPFFGNKKINEITPDDIQVFYNSIMDLSKSTSNQCKAVLCGIFDRAARNGDIDRNIMLFKYDRSMKQGKKIVLQDDDLIDVIDKLILLEGKDYLYGCLLCFTAMRRGEILGLKWEDFDFEKREIHVKHNVTFPNGDNNPVILEPKDGSSGIVHLQSGLYERLLPYKRKTGYLISKSDDEPNKPITKSMFIKMWRRINKAIDLKGATSHSFRASYATMMNAHCVHIDPKALQGALRHKTPDLALKVYTKENTDKTRQAEIEYDNWLKEHLA